MKKIKCMAIDDEPLALKIIERYVQQIPDLELIATFDNAIDGNLALQEHEVDLLFLDIHGADIIHQNPRMKSLTFFGFVFFYFFYGCD